MKTNKPNRDDAPLDALLHEWKALPPLPPRFRDEVWRRIERTATPAPGPSVTLATLLANLIATKLPRPALATAYLTILFAIGAGVGWNQARHETERVTSNLRARYAQTVDPFQRTP